MIPETEQKDDKKKSIFRMKNKNKSDNNIIVLEIYFRDFKKKINYKNVEKILKKIDQQRRGHPLSNG